MELRMKMIKKWSKNVVVMLCILAAGCLSLHAAIKPKDSKTVEKQLKEMLQKLGGLKNNLTMLSKRLGELKTKLTTPGGFSLHYINQKLLEMGLTKADIKRIPLSERYKVETALDWHTKNPPMLSGFDDAIVGQLLSMGFSLDNMKRIPDDQKGSAQLAIGWLSANPEPSGPSIVPQSPNVGLANANNDDCFFSASFQILSQIKPFVQALEALSKKSDVQREFLDFIQALREKGTGKYKPGVDATQVFRRFITEDRWGNTLKEMKFEQQDAQEFLSEFLDKLTELEESTIAPIQKAFSSFFEKNFILKKPSFTEFIVKFRNAILPIKLLDKNTFVVVVKQVLNALVDKPTPAVVSIKDIDKELQSMYEIISADVLKEFLRKNKEAHEVRSIFTLNVSQKFICTFCKSQWTGGDDKAMLLVLDLEQPILIPGQTPKPLPQTTLIDRLRKYFQVTKVDYICPTCGIQRIVDKQFIIQQPLPKILTLGFNRIYADWAEEKAMKLEQAVTFPLTLDPGYLKPFLEDGQGVKYELFGIVMHTGVVFFDQVQSKISTGGHYRAYTKDRFDGKWREYDDAKPARVVEVSEINKIAQQTLEVGAPYVLFYEKV